MRTVKEKRPQTPSVINTNTITTVRQTLVDNFIRNFNPETSITGYAYIIRMDDKRKPIYGNTHNASLGIHNEMFKFTASRTRTLLFTVAICVYK